MYDLFRVKKNIPLKKLKEFGFVRKNNLYQIGLPIYRGEYATDSIYIHNRIVKLDFDLGDYSHGTSSKDALCILYDLIKSDIVEKVENANIDWQ